VNDLYAILRQAVSMITLQGHTHLLPVLFVTPKYKSD